jgi:hypothetical protein
VNVQLKATRAWGLPDVEPSKEGPFRSPIASHAARPKLADTPIRTSATRAQARIDILAIAPSSVRANLLRQCQGGVGCALGVESYVARVEGQVAPMVARLAQVFDSCLEVSDCGLKVTAVGASLLAAMAASARAKMDIRLITAPHAAAPVLA